MSVDGDQDVYNRLENEQNDYLFEDRTVLDDNERDQVSDFGHDIEWNWQRAGLQFNPRTKNESREFWIWHYSGY